MAPQSAPQCGIPSPGVHGHYQRTRCSKVTLGKGSHVGFFFPLKVRGTLKIVGSSEMGLGREPSYYKAKLKILQAFGMPGRLSEKRSDGHFQDLEENLVMSADEVGWHL